jgi:3'-phosphoadenosine 5'-phosphosulfate (PAPS) 3'-phosphatase
MFDRVGEILRHRGARGDGALEPGDFGMKGADDPVTIADREAETMIGQGLRALLPQARVVGKKPARSTRLTARRTLPPHGHLLR